MGEKSLGKGEIYTHLRSYSLTPGWSESSLTQWPAQSKCVINDSCCFIMEPSSKDSKASAVSIIFLKCTFDSCPIPFSQQLPIAFLVKLRLLSLTFKSLSDSGPTCQVNHTSCVSPFTQFALGSVIKVNIAVVPVNTCGCLPFLFSVHFLTSSHIPHFHESL